MNPRQPVERRRYACANKEKEKGKGKRKNTGHPRRIAVELKSVMC
jgi:hypothetical protein